MSRKTELSSVAILMRTKNSSDILPQTLKALFSQSFQRFDFIVVDSGSTDGTLALLNHYPCSITQIKAEDYYPGKILNTAIQPLSASLIVFLNSDAVLLTPNALEIMVSTFSDPEIQAAFGRQIARPDAEAWVRRDYLAAFPPLKPAPEWMALSLPFAAIRRSAWEERHFYTDAWGSEDMEWGRWAKKRGFNIQYLPEAAVMHSHNYTLKQLYGRRFIEGEADAYSLKGFYSFPKMMGNIFKATIRDMVFYLKSFEFIGLFKIPFLRLVYFWSYWKGFRLGKKRIKKGDRDGSIGQREVLRRYK